MGEHMAYNEQKFIEYFYALKTMDVYHKELFGNNKDFEVPQLFSQEIVKHFLDLQDYTGEGKKFDAEKDGRYYEIKATSSESGTTTLNFASKPDVLVWIKFDFENSEFEIKQFEGFDLLGKMNDFYTQEALDRRHEGAKNLFESKSRETVILNNVNWKIIKKYKVQTVITTV